MLSFFGGVSRKAAEKKLAELQEKIDQVSREDDENNNGRSGYTCVQSEDNLPQDHRAEWRAWKSVHDDCERKLRRLYSEVGGVRLEQERASRMKGHFWFSVISFWLSVAFIAFLVHSILDIGWAASGLVGWLFCSITTTIERNQKKLDRILAILVEAEARRTASEDDTTIEDARLDVEELRWV